MRRLPLRKKRRRRKATKKIGAQSPCATLWIACNEHSYLEAIREAQAKLLRDDERVFIYGQDVGGTFGGAFKATKGLAKECPCRVLNAPISEDAIVGTAIGAAMQGMRPIVEMQFADFSSIALNQILTQAGTHYWRTGVPVPITVRLPSGGTKGSGPFHSQSM